MIESIKKIAEKINDWFYDGSDPEYLNTISKTIEKKYISRNAAIDIADKEKNLRHHMYKDAKKKGYLYGLIEIYDYFAILVKYNENFAWYIKVADAKYYGKNQTKYFHGYFTEYDNIACLVMAETSEFLYLGKFFDTRQIRLVTDDEFLEYIHNVKH